MGRDFTDFVEGLGSSQAAPEAESLDRVWKALLRALCSEIRKRGLWETPPGYLGVFGWESWSDEALDELTTDCYVFVFVRRLQSLRAQLKTKPKIEGLVFLGIRNFLHERQKYHDPIGFRVFEALRLATHRAIDAGRLSVGSGDLKIRNDTVLEIPQTASRETESTLADLIPRWAGELIPDLMTARAKQREAMLKRLCTRLDDLSLLGLDAVRFKDLVDPLKHEVRSRWAAIFDHSLGEVAAEKGEDATELVRVVDPARLELESRGSFERLVRCVNACILRPGLKPSTRDELLRLWSFLADHAAASDRETPAPLSQRKLAGLLGIPRKRLPEHFATLAQAVKECRSTHPEVSSR